MPKHLPLSLLLLRLSIFIVFLVWAFDKFVQPDHAAQVLDYFYGLRGMGNSVFYVIGGAQLVLALTFVAGFCKTWTYGLVTLLHAASTLLPFKLYLQPFDNLLFFAAWPMLAACIALFLLRNYDRLTLGHTKYA